MKHFKAARAEDPKDHCSAFAMGVTSELLGDHSGALKHYRQAAGMPDVDDEKLAMYLSAKDRVASHQGRIRG